VFLTGALVVEVVVVVLVGVPVLELEVDEVLEFWLVVDVVDVFNPAVA
jgi:hypothetical protein